MDPWLCKGDSRILESLNALALNGTSLEQVDTLLNDVDLYKPPMPRLGVFNGVELLSVEPVDVADLAEPVLQWGVVVQALARCTNSTAIIVPTYDNVRNFQHCHSVSDNI
jgi:hypothetical protein